jgi:peptide deformylase
MLLPFDHPLLETRSEPITEFDGRVAELADLMFEVLDDEGGTSLAAVQIGAAQRVIVVSAFDASGDLFRQALVNPRILARSEDHTTEHESCLSMPGYMVPVPRHDRIEVAFELLDGEPGTIIADGALSVCLQQAIDLTDGLLFIDRVSDTHRAQSDDISKTARRRARLH